MQFPASAGPQAYFTTNGVLFCSRNSFCCNIGIGFLLNHTPSKGFCHMQKPRCNLHRGFLAERMRLERTMPCGTPHFQCGSLPIRIPLHGDFDIITHVPQKIKGYFEFFSCESCLCNFSVKKHKSLVLFQKSFGIMIGRKSSRLHAFFRPFAWVLCGDKTARHASARKSKALWI